MNEYEEAHLAEEESNCLPVAVVPKLLPPTNEAIQAVTAAQAKVNAIADLTQSAYQKAATLKLTKEESESLQADFPDEAFKTGAAGKDNLIYIEHAFLRDRFTKVFGMGQWCIISRRSWSEPFKTERGTEGERVYVEAMLVARGCFIGEAIGAMEYYPKNAAQNYGDAVEGGKTAAFRRCAKEFGVGLQAWKKDWCQGWFDRKMGKRPAAAPTASRPAAAKLAAPKVIPEPTSKTREWFINELALRHMYPLEQVTQFCIDLAWLMPNETLMPGSDGKGGLELRYVANTPEKLKAFRNCLDNWIAKGDTVQPYDCPIPDPAKKPVEVPRGPMSGPHTATAVGEDWYGIIVPIPHKGQKRDEYLKNPDTIGSLFDLRHDSSDEGAAARSRLWGFVTNYEPKGWKGRDGKDRPASASDIAFRASLDQFSEWFEKNHPDEKL